MKNRYKMSSKASKSNFKAGARKVHPFNTPPTQSARFMMRGGIRM